MVQSFWSFADFNLPEANILNCIKFKFLTVSGLRVPFCTTVPIVKIGQAVANIAIFLIFHYGGRRRLRFSKIPNFNRRSTLGAKYASSCQILSKSAKRSRRHRDSAISKMAAVHHLGLVGRVFRQPTKSTWWCSVFIVQHNLVGIDVVVSIIRKFQYFARLT